MGKFSVCREKSDVASKIEHTVKCSLCGEILCCSSENTAPLVGHLRKNHPNVQVARFPELKPGEECKEQDEVKSIKSADKCVAKSQCVNDLAAGDHKKECAREKKYKKMFKTTVEVWQCSKGSMLCEKCGEYQTPVERVRKKCLSESSATALCLLGCWPLCFLPFMMCGRNPETNVTDFFCSKCGQLIKSKININCK